MKPITTPGIWEYITQKYINPDERRPPLTLLDMYIFDEIMKELAPALEPTLHDRCLKARRLPSKTY